MGADGLREVGGVVVALFEQPATLIAGEEVYLRKPGLRAPRDLQKQRLQMPQHGRHRAAAETIGVVGDVEGEHGFLHGFARTTSGSWDKLVEGFGKRWVTETVAFKLYPCGTMTHPYIDCARRLAPRVTDPSRVREIVCETAEGIVHRLWEPLAAKQRPPTAYAAKFSVPFCVAYGLTRGAVGRFRVSNLFADGKMELSLRGHAHEELKLDAEKVLDRLRAGKLRVGDGSSPEQIRQVFGLSKKAFKRAVGTLLVRRAVRIDDAGFVVVVS